MTAAVGAADAMAKAAPVAVVGPALAGAGLVTIFVHGEIAAVREALDAGARAASGIGRVLASSVIGRPTADLVGIFDVDDRPPFDGIRTERSAIEKLPATQEAAEAHRRD